MKYVVAACAGEQVSGAPETLINRVCTDSRQAQRGDLFVALAGERFDGHDFLAEVARKGAAAVLINRSKATVTPAIGCAVITVADPRQALGRLAARYRMDFALPVIAVGGSNGKTTTKELLAAVLRQKLTTLASEASFNNDIGVPLTLLKLEAPTQVGVLEVATNHPGELAPLLRMIQPKFGIITSLGREHLEYFENMNGVIEEEGWLAELLPADGKLFVNGDSEGIERIAKRSRAPIVRVGLSDKNDWRARDIQSSKQGALFQVEAPKAELAGEYRINLSGRHQVVNALFGLVVGAELGLGRADIQRGLADCKPLKMRLQLWEVNGIQVLDDSYNANADSMLVALQVLQELPCAGRRVAVLGDMAELGAHSPAAHEEVGRRAAELGVEQLFAVGKMARAMAGAARSAGLNRVFEFDDVETAGHAVKNFLKTGDLVLLKASRATRLERVGEILRGRRPGDYSPEGTPAKPK
ncbi:MAG: UDP-N-acetylmuramoyl-tripeptide--D-alanyl-D-alanine ligase [Verrucomicrobia bacterium]|nr:UDP-N-acetylmuramoyl-tripeptide--D-alanyl-D-alanine ligase [Verrucomicrobiota bacterium]